MYDDRPSWQLEQRLVERASMLFEQAWRTGQFKRIWASLTGKSRLIPLLGDVEKQHSDGKVQELGVLPVRIENIIGTEGKLSFDKDFYPLQRRSRQRWIGVAVGMLRDATRMPPIDVVKVGKYYYIKDGHHRVSVARMLDHIYIDGDVTEWITPETEANTTEN